jgi:hypothetical protein
MTPLAAALRPLAPALAVALVGCLLGFGGGAAMGAAEDAMKKGLADDAAAVVDTVYGGDAAKAKAVVDKSWSYYKRGHLHGGALATFALALAVLLALLPGSSRLRGSVGLAASVGSVGYGVFWWWAGARAPGLGSTALAKESLAWLAIPSSAAVIGGTLLALVLVLRLLWAPRDA